MKMHAGATALLMTLLVVDIEVASADTKGLIRTYDRPDYPGNVTISLDGKQAISFAYQGRDERVEVGGLDIPAGAKQLQFSGQINWQHGEHGPIKTAGTASLPLLDLTPVVRPLRGKETWPKRLSQFLASKETFEQTHAQRLSDVQVTMEAGERASASALKSAAKRLGYAIPPEHVQVLEQFGAFSISDSFTTPAEQLQNAQEQMVKMWESPRSSIDALPESTKAFFRSSVILFTTAGDGYGAVLYRPPAADAAGDAGTFHYTHQDNLTEIQPLKNRDGSPKNYSQTLLWFLATEGLSYYTSSGEVVGVDHSGKTPQIYELNVEPERTKLRFSLYLEWSQFE